MNFWLFLDTYLTFNISNIFRKMKWSKSEELQLDHTCFGQLNSHPLSHNRILLAKPMSTRLRAACYCIHEAFDSIHSSICSCSRAPLLRVPLCDIRHPRLRIAPVLLSHRTSVPPTAEAPRPIQGPISVMGQYLPSVQLPSTLPRGVS